MKSVLIVDDERVVREVFGSILAANGYNVVGTAENGLEAVRESLSLRPDLIIMDLVMPGLDGLKATREVLRQLPETKVVICTAYSTAEALEETLLAGAHGFIDKPFNTSLLLRVLSDVENGESSFPPGYEPNQARVRRGKQPLPSPLETFSTRERQILTLISDGKTPREIASLLGLRHLTVCKYRRAIKAKLGGNRAPDLKEFARSLRFLRGGTFRDK